MNEQEIAEQAYKNGYKNGYKEGKSKAQKKVDELREENRKLSNEWKSTSQYAYKLCCDNEKLEENLLSCRYANDVIKINAVKLQKEIERLTEENKNSNLEILRYADMEFTKKHCDLYSENEALKQWLNISSAKNEELQKQVDELKDRLKDLDWYKMWHNKHKKEIDDLTLELETYRPTKLHGNGQCKCSNCKNVSWTDWVSNYKGQTLCDKCLKEIVTTEEKQAVKDTAKEIFALLKSSEYVDSENTLSVWAIEKIIKERYGVEAE